MGHSVIYYGEHDGARTVRALELAPDDLNWGVVSPEMPEYVIEDAENEIASGNERGIRQS